ncbi:DctP family TRAP transporter solute-binding subunit [Halobacillus litoralis]|uniref:DctP family TRAP transporter solute-binding subunit n=1 Tax=Halobacillus litoralis TaxID=45668 RepID=UPI001CFE9EB9|nr:DctP family TRAP transporter solute-binding subunit [Halobacillus litoralis]
MKAFFAISLFIFTGIFTALFFGFGLGEASEPLEYDDEQEGLEDEIVIKFSHVAAENTPKGQAVRKFASLIQKRTDGEIKVEIHANGTLYNDQNEYQALKNNHIQMIAPATSKLTDKFPKWQVLDLPFAFPTYKDVKKAYEGPIGQTLLTELKNDQVKGLSFWYNGYKQMTSSEDPLLRPSDFKLMHFRIMPSPVIKAQYQALGASTSVLPFNKIYENLDVDFINGQENTASNIYTKKLYETQDHMTISNHGYLGYVVLMNEIFWKELSKEHQDIIQKTMAETTDWSWRHSIEMNDSQLREMKRTDAIEVHYLNDQQKQLWEDALESVYKEARPVIGDKLFNEVMKLKEHD